MDKQQASSSQMGVDVMKKSRNVNNINCSVFGCSTRKGRDRAVSFHRFPKRHECKVQVQNRFGEMETMDKLAAWTFKLKMGKPVTKYMKVCSRHFKKDDYISSESSLRAKLKKSAVPTLNLPTTCLSFKKNVRLSTDRFNRALNRSKRIKITGANISPTKKELDAAHALILLLQEGDDPVTSTKEILAPIDNSVEIEQVKINFPSEPTCSKWTQVTSGDIVSPFVSLIVTNKKLNTLTGLGSFDSLNAIVEVINSFYTDKRVHKLTMRERVILTLMKLKSGVKFNVLEIIFRTITRTTCRVIFEETLPLIVHALKPVIYWPTQEECRNNLPTSFEAFSNVRVVLDCTEIPVQKPKCLCCRLKTYSQYKSRNTIKFLTGISPGGLITFISRAYGGRVSDSAIFKQNELIKKLEMFEDAIMVDKGFRIKDLTDSCGVKLIQPPYLQKKSQFSPEEAQLNRKIAAARVHVERSYQRIKLWDIFNHPLPWHLIGKVKDMFFIACALTNLSNPILGEQCFK